jgi:2,4-dienoyl-CoA reductase-like NADH-dependent reductase (Old Yellow Enzyme family)/NADPH-dependent 2,4-dienoyl-CoA reductase/sulfur reductase-like enzyme
VTVTLLKQPGAIGPLRLKNRVIMGPLGTNYGTTDGFSTDRDKAYYAERAKGGAALIITEAMNISAAARNHRNSLCVFHDRFIPGLSAVVRAIQDNGALAVAQLNHRGQLLQRSVLDMEPVGPSPGRNAVTGDTVRGLEIDEIVAIQRDFVEAGVRLARAGYDAIEIHAANGYLFQQFFSERFNRRTDRYGGTLDNRMRFLIETVQHFRDRLPDTPLLVRISATEYAPGGYSEDEAVALAQALERAGVAAIDLSGGTNESPALSRYCIQPPSFARRFLEPYARPIKAAVAVPVIVAGRIITPADAEGVLTAGSADFVALCRALVADPHWCLKAFGELDAPIRPCIACNVCYERLSRERDVACVQNPLVGTEFEALARLEPQTAPRTRAPKRVLVVGGGVAGVEAARVAAAGGHVVEIWERAERLGGQMKLALAAPDKAEVAGVWDYRMAALVKLRVPMRTGVALDAAAIRAFAPDLVIVATGARPRGLALPASLDRPVRQAWDVLDEPSRVPPGAAVTIIGGGMVGIETADVLVARGHPVTVIEATAIVAREMARNNRFDVLARLEAAGVEILTETTVAGYADGRLALRQRGAAREIVCGALVVLAIGPEPDRDAVPAIEAAGAPYVLIGDCNQPGDFMTGLADAQLVALALDNP